MKYGYQGEFRTKIVELTDANSKWDSNYRVSDNTFNQVYSQPKYKNKIFQLSFNLEMEDFDSQEYRLISIRSDKIENHFQEFSTNYGLFTAVVELSFPNDFPSFIEIRYPVLTEEIINERIQEAMSEIQGWYSRLKFIAKND